LVPDLKLGANNATLSSSVAPDLLRAYRLPLFGVQVDDLLAQATEEQMARYEAGKPVMSFTEFLAKVSEDPQRYLPTTTSYIERAFQHFGLNTEEILGEEIPVYNASSVPWRSSLLSRDNHVVGQEHVISQFVKQI